MIKAILFDLDGVILDTEAHYSQFWKELCQHYFPDEHGLEERIKGQTLTQIYSSLFVGMESEFPAITNRLNDFERTMTYDYIDGFTDFIPMLRNRGLKTAIVTSSNEAKMQNVHRVHPELAAWFDTIVTAEHCKHSKPAPDGYLKGAELLGCRPEECVGFEDSINGLKAVRSAGMRVVGLATTNPEDVVRPLADIVVGAYDEKSVDRLLNFLEIR